MYTYTHTHTHTDLITAYSASLQDGNEGGAKLCVVKVGTDTTITTANTNKPNHKFKTKEERGLPPPCPRIEKAKAKQKGRGVECKDRESKPNAHPAFVQKHAANAVMVVRVTEVHNEPGVIEPRH